MTPESDQCQNSPAASQEIWHHTVWRTWLFIAYSDEKWLYYNFSLYHSYNHFLKGWENTLFELRSERVNLEKIIISAQICLRLVLEFFVSKIIILKCSTPWFSHRFGYWTVTVICPQQSCSKVSSVFLQPSPWECHPQRKWQFLKSQAKKPHSAPRRCVHDRQPDWLLSPCPKAELLCQTGQQQSISHYVKMPGTVQWTLLSSFAPHFLWPSSRSKGRKKYNKWTVSTLETIHTNTWMHACMHDEILYWAQWPNTYTLTHNSHKDTQKCRMHHTNSYSTHNYFYLSLFVGNLSGDIISSKRIHEDAW